MALAIRSGADLICSGQLDGGTGVEYDEARAMIKDFCMLKAGHTFGVSSNLTEVYKTAMGNSRAHLSVSHVNVKQPADHACNTASDAAVIVVQAECEKAFYRLIDECDTSTTSSNKYGGTIASGCSIYSLTTAIQEVIRCGGNPWNRPVDLPSHIMSEGIEDYCNTPLELTPDYVPNTQFLMEPRSGQSFGNYLKHGMIVKTVTQFNSQGQSDCGPSRPFSTRGAECRRKLQAIQERCGGQGGGLSQSNNHGCVLWTLWGQSAV